MIEQERQPSAGVVSQAPSTRSLVKATLVALVLAVVVLVVAVLPAEYGIDPTGVGRATGLMDLYEAGESAMALTGAAPIVPTAEGPVFRQLNDYRVDRREFTIPPRTGMEFKYRLDRGATMLYAWRATAFVDFDFHTEPAGQPPEASDSFELGSAAQSRGAYVAPYAGIHGWYWENPTDRDVTVTLETAGFYQAGTLFLPTGIQEFKIPERDGIGTP
jgi:hypothetical protein